MQYLTEEVYESMSNKVSGPNGETLLSFKSDKGTLEKEEVVVITTQGDRDIADLLMLLEETESLVLKVKEKLGEISARTRLKGAKIYTNRNLVDVGFLCREIENWFDEVRKDAKARRELFGMLLAQRVAQAALEGNMQSTVRGTLATATPDVEQVALLPKRHTPEYDAFCKHFGIASDAREASIFAPHYTSMVEYVTKLVSEGKALPPGVKLRSSRYSCSFRRRGGKTRS